jgi:hypothetical protein
LAGTGGAGVISKRWFEELERSADIVGASLLDLVKSIESLSKHTGWSANDILDEFRRHKAYSKYILEKGSIQCFGTNVVFCQCAGLLICGCENKGILMSCPGCQFCYQHERFQPPDQEIDPVELERIMNSL